MKYKLVACTISIILIFATCTCVYLNQNPYIVVFHAGSLSTQFSILEECYEKEHGIDVKREVGGSAMLVAQVSAGLKSPDILAVSDYTLLLPLIPNYINNYTLFATDCIGLAYTAKSRYYSEINTYNWYFLLARKDVRIGFSNPIKDPCGYRSLISIKLSDIYYEKNIFEELVSKNCNIYALNNTIYVPLVIESNQKLLTPDKEIDFLTLLDVGAVDYVFLYKKVAFEQNYKFLQLPAEINLGNINLENYYSKITVRTDERVIHGSAIQYAIAELNTAKPIAKDFLRFVLEKYTHEN